MRAPQPCKKNAWVDMYIEVRQSWAYAHGDFSSFLFYDGYTVLHFLPLFSFKEIQYFEGFGYIIIQIGHYIVYSIHIHMYI